MLAFAVGGSGRNRAGRPFFSEAADDAQYANIFDRSEWYCSGCKAKLNRIDETGVVEVPVLRRVFSNSYFAEAGGRLPPSDGLPSRPPLTPPSTSMPAPNPGGVTDAGCAASYHSKSAADITG